VLQSNSQIMGGDQNWTTRVTGTTPDYFLIRSWSVSSGTTLTQSDLDGGTKVAVLGQTVVDKLFGVGTSAVGQSIRIKNVPFQVIGVLIKKGQSAMGQDYDDAVFVPQTTFLSKIQGGLQKYLSGVIFVGAASQDATSRAETEIGALLRDRHHIGGGQDDDFSVRNLAEMASAQEEGTKTLTNLLLGIAAVSLLVGGIGIMNIMLVSVTERTREIGVRMAVGAKPYHILAQFLVVALTLSVIGGLLGVGAGVSGAAWLAVKLGGGMVVRPDIIVISVLFSGIVGMGFGLYPAYKASRLDPIDALRYE
jgi:putative ABC transport system permease protein